MKQVKTPTKPKNLNDFRLKNIIIENFKSHKNLSLDFNRLNEIFGANATGKTSVMEAIKFAFVGGKGDVDKIRIGEEKCSVVLTFQSGETPLEIKTTLDRKGQLNCSVQLEGIKNQNPRTFIKNMISYGSFNPRKALDPKTRLSTLLNLVPVKICEKDLLDFPEQALIDLDFDQHAFVVLTQLLKNLSNIRLSLYQNKDTLSKAHQKASELLDRETSQFLAENSFNSLDECPTYEAVQDKMVEVRASNQVENEKADKLVSDMELNRQEEAQLSRSVESKKDYVTKLESQLGNARNDFEESKKRLKEVKEFVEKNEKNLEEAKALILKNNETISNINNKATIAKYAERLRDRQKLRIKNLEEVTQAVASWKDIDSIIKNDFKNLSASALSPLKEKIKGIDVTPEGKLLYKGKSIDELSGAETILLSSKLISLDEKSNFLLIDEGEALDKNSVEELEKLITDKSIWLFRVAESALGGPWKSKELKKEG